MFTYTKFSKQLAKIDKLHYLHNNKMLKKISDTALQPQAEPLGIFFPKKLKIAR